MEIRYGHIEPLGLVERPHEISDRSIAGEPDDRRSRRGHFSGEVEAQEEAAITTAPCQEYP